MKLTKSRLKAIIKEELKIAEAEEMITLPGETTGGGTMRVDQLQKRITDKLEDLLKRVKEGDWLSISKEQLLILANEWGAIRTHLGTPEELDIEEVKAIS